MERKSRTWISEEAEVALNHWLKQNEQSWRADGADPEEVREDVEMHLQTKAESLGRSLDPGDLETTLGEMGMPVLEQPAVVLMKETGKKWSFFPFGWMRMLKNRFFLGAWPLLVIVIEAISGVFGNIVFDPISRWPQLALLLGVGGVAWAGQFLKKEKRDQGWFRFLIGVGFIPAVYWGILSLLVMITATAYYLWGVIASVGIALLLSPIVFICMVIAAAPILAGAGFWKASSGRRRQLPWLGGLAVGLALLAVVEGPAYVTRYGLANNDPALARNYGSETNGTDLSVFSVL